MRWLESRGRVLRCPGEKLVRRGGVEVLGAGEDSQAVFLSHSFRVLMQEHTVGLEVNQTAGLEELAVTLQEKGRSEARILALHLGIRKSQPDLRNFRRCEKGSDELYAGAQKSHIVQLILVSILGSLPEACPLDIHTDIVTRRNAARQIDGILPFPAAQFQDYRLSLLEHPFVPAALYLVVAQSEISILKKFFRRRLKQTGKTLILSKFS